jgi:O-antigen/teichoic acid export membrane protein
MSEADVTGQDRLAKNVVAGYAGHFVFIVLGFIMPRVIDTHVGQVGLGIWDFSWSFVNYLNVAMIGIGSSVNRFVAKYRTSNDLVALGRLVSTVVAVQIAIAAAVLAASGALFFFIPVLFSARLGGQAGTAGYVVGLLGASLAVQMAFDAWRGVLSGCHRWDYYNAINAGGYAVTALIMIVVLLSGGGLVGIASAYLAVTFVTELVRYFVARRVCPELVLSRAAVNRDDARKVVRFGVRTVVLSLPAIIVIQTASLFVATSLGPAALAVLARPLSLVHHVSTLMNKYSYVLTPIAGSIQGAQDSAELQRFVFRHARAGWLFAIPPLSFMFVLGDVLLELWMGAEYADQKTIAILCVGFLASISQSPILRILTGLNAHGRVAKSGAIVASVILIVGILIGREIGGSIQYAAALISVGIGVGMGLNAFVSGFVILGLDLKQYAREVGKDALKLLGGLLATLVVVRYWFGDFGNGTVLLAGSVTTIAVFALIQRQDLLQIIRGLKADSTAKG